MTREFSASPDGQAIGRVSVFTLSHLTWRDTKRQRASPDPGEVTAERRSVSCELPLTNR